MPWETTHESIVRKFADVLLPMPKIVYWNLRATLSAPVADKNTPGVALLSGFSAGLVKSFLENTLSEFTPASILAGVLADDVYQSLVVAEEDAA